MRCPKTWVKVLLKYSSLKSKKIFFPTTCILVKGIPIKPGQNRDSIMSALPFTDSAVLNEMNDAYENCVTIEEEIEQLKKEMLELMNVSFKYTRQLKKTHYIVALFPTEV